MKVLLECIKEMLQDVIRVLISNVYNFYKLLMFVCPYLMFYLGMNNIKASIALIVPVIVWIIASLVHRLANKNNKGDCVPVPRKRFTEVNEELDGYTINQEDINEIILYLGEVEDYLEKRRLL